jgi:hypothetical protein
VLVAFHGKLEEVINQASLFKSDDLPVVATVAKLDISALASNAASNAALSSGFQLRLANDTDLP